MRIGWVITMVSLLGLAGCGPKKIAVRRESPPLPPLVVAQKPIHLDPPESERARILVEYFRKPVMGRMSSLRDVERIVHDITPILERASRQPEAAPDLQLLADDSGVDVDTARERWVRLQEADILLESGGNPDDVSSANAVGVAQWIFETGTRAGLKVDLRASDELTARIASVKRKVAWIEYLRAPGADPNAPGNPGLTVEQATRQSPAAREQLETLRAKRRIVDERYDPEKALAAHTRYLLGLYRKFPDLSWVFQAFHGGEAGVARTLARYVGPKMPGTPAQWVRRGGQGHRLTYAQVYFTSSPSRHPAAFSYLYGRGDDHRHYWWKIRAAVEAFALYRKNPAAFRRVWESLLPGRAKEAMWRPDGPKYAYSTWGSIREAVWKSELVDPAGLPGINVAPQSPMSTAALRLETAGLLKLLATACKRAGFKSPLPVGTSTLPAEAMVTRSKAPVKPGWPPARAEPDLPGGGPPGSFDYHATGWAFDIPRPADDGQRKRLEYALGFLRDRDILWFIQEAEYGPRRYHVVPNPVYQADLTRIGKGGALPPFTAADISTGRISRPSR